MHVGLLLLRCLKWPVVLSTSLLTHEKPPLPRSGKQCRLVWNNSIWWISSSSHSFLLFHKVIFAFLRYLQFTYFVFPFQSSKFGREKTPNILPPTTPFNFPLRKLLHGINFWKPKYEILICLTMERISSVGIRNILLRDFPDTFNPLISVLHPPSFTR